MKIQELSTLTESQLQSEAAKGAALKAGQKKKLIGAMSSSSEVKSEIRRLEDQIKDYNRRLAKYQAELKIQQQKLSKMADSGANKAYQDLAARIKKECSNYLNVFATIKRPLWRGVSDDSHMAYEARSWDKRESKDSNPEMAKAFDQAASKLGMKALRGNSIYTSGSRGHAEEYGVEYIIVPKNSANFTWSRTTRDLVLDSWDKLPLKTGANNYHQLLTQEQKWLNAELNKAYKVLDKSKTTKDEEVAYRIIHKLEDYSEVLSQIDDYLYSRDLYDVNQNEVKKAQKNFPDRAFLKDIFKMVQEVPQMDLVKFQKRYQLDNTDLPKAIKSNKEVMIQGEYFAIHPDLWQDLQQQGLLPDVDIRNDY